MSCFPDRHRQGLIRLSLQQLRSILPRLSQVGALRVWSWTRSGTVNLKNIGSASSTNQQAPTSSNKSVPPGPPSTTHPLLLLNPTSTILTVQSFSHPTSHSYIAHPHPQTPRHEQSAIMVDWNNFAIIERLALALWTLSKESFNSENKERILAELRTLDDTITWNALR